MKEIKFRAWDFDEKKMTNGFGRPQLVIRLSGEVTEGSTTPRMDLMQYTGLKDKNGKEIYECDIIQHQNEEADKRPYPVPLMDIAGMEIVCSIGDSEWEVGRGQYSNIEVLGNLYENPALLK